jgi:hypothetical protein
LNPFCGHGCKLQGKGWQLQNKILEEWEVLTWNELYMPPSVGLKSILPQTIGDFERVFFEWTCASNFELVNLLWRYQICST